MTRLSHWLPVVALGCALAACGSDDEKQPVTPVNPANDGGVAATDGGAAIPLVAWVDDLVTNHTTEMSLPDTVDDKKISDDENPQTFDKYFVPKP